MVERTINNFRFPGQYYIEETGLYYNWWRWYEREVGRYVEFDKILLNEDFDLKLIYPNCCSYVHGNPIYNIDPKGLRCKNVNHCLLCIYLYGDDNTSNYAKTIYWKCDSIGVGCPSGEGKCCGYTEVGSYSIVITNNERGNCKYTCYTVLHEIAHAVLNISSDSDADRWADEHIPYCCRSR